MATPEKTPPSVEDVLDDDDESTHSHEYQSHHPQSFPRRFSGQQPLINYVSNEWKKEQSRSVSTLSSAGNSSSFDWHRSSSPWLAFLMSLILAPKFRRSLMVSVILLTLVYLGWEAFLLQASMHEPQVIIEPLGDVQEAIDRASSWTVTNARPEFVDFVPMKVMDAALLPKYERTRFKASERRLVFVGDVHGCQGELEQLLKKISFNQTAGDHLIFTGDMITKGPRSSGVIDIARNLNASCVRGDDEDRILLERADLKYRNVLDVESFNEFDTPKYTPEGRDIARSLNDEQAAWLQDCPAILKIGQIRGMGEVVAVHGGLTPGIPLEHQDLLGVMTMRNIDIATRIPTPNKKAGMPWYKLYNEYNTLLASGKLSPESANTELSTVIYGHDTTETYNIRPYTKGLDSGCIYGRELSALVIEDGGRTRVVQVKCNEMCKA